MLSLTKIVYNALMQEAGKTLYILLITLLWVQQNSAEAKQSRCLYIPVKVLFISCYIPIDKYKEKEQKLLSFTMSCYSAQCWHSFKSTTSWVFILPLIALSLTAAITSPITGTVANTCVRRFKVIQASVAFLISWSLLNLLLILLQDYLTTATAIILVLLVQGLCCVRVRGGQLLFFN